jgi:hypothetical protein
MFVFTDLLNGGLYQMIFLWRLRFVVDDIVVGLQLEYSKGTL